MKKSVMCPGWSKATVHPRRPKIHVDDGVCVGEEGQVLPAAEVEPDAEGAADEAAEARDAVPDLEEVEGPLDELLGVVREDVHEVRPDEARDDRPERELADDLFGEAELFRALAGEDGAEDDPGADEEAEGVQLEPEDLERGEGKDPCEYRGRVEHRDSSTAIGRPPCEPPL